MAFHEHWFKFWAVTFNGRNITSGNPSTVLYNNVNKEYCDIYNMRFSIFCSYQLAKEVANEGSIRWYTWRGVIMKNWIDVPIVNAVAAACIRWLKIAASADINASYWMSQVYCINFYRILLLRCRFRTSVSSPISIHEVISRAQPDLLRS